MPSLADLEKSPLATRMERDFTAILDVPLVRKIALLTSAAQELSTSRKQADRVKYRETLDEIEALQPEIDAKSGKLLLRAQLTSGEWRRFVDENPPRLEGEPGHDRDQRRAYGMVNADALIDVLDRFAYSWEGDVLAPGQFDRLLRDNIPAADLAEMATAVVLMYEVSPDFTGLRSALSGDLEKLRAFAEHETSESAPSDSTGGNPEPSNADETETETPAT